jgi:hypothetical protein
MAYRYGDRSQKTLFPQSIDEYISQDAPVRAYDVIINSLDFGKLGIEIEPHKVGCPQYDPYQLPKSQEIYKLRKQKVELPFGHIKRNLKAGHFLLRGLDGVKAEMSLLAGCFNIVRMINIVGVCGLFEKLAG